MKRTAQTAREAALQALLELEENHGYSNLVLDKVLRLSRLTRRDSALASAIFYGALEKRLTLDYFLRQCLTRPDRKLDRTAREALRCGAYQIIFLDRVPDSAAVNETVHALKTLGKESLAGFVNGVLRGLIRKKDRLTLPPGNGLDALSIRYSVPKGLIKLWQSSYGDSITGKLLESLLEPSKLYVRVNLLKTDMERIKIELEREGIGFEPLNVPNGAGILYRCGAPGELDAFRRGLFHVQDLSAQWVCRILDPKPGELVCDCCSAPGGKSFSIAQEIGSSGKVFAFDLYQSRTALVKAGAERLGLANVFPEVNDALQGFGDMPLVDRMLCDVPCSGFGVIRRKPEIRYKSLDELAGLPKLQYEILRQASAKVKPGGMLVYSTCTLNPMENQEVAERFLRENPGFQPAAIEIGLGRVMEEPGYMLTMTSFAGASDGFFAAAFRKNMD